MRLLNASGCLDALTTPEVAAAFDAFVTKTVTPLPRGGNPPIRIAETDVGILNAIGLANPGIDRFLSEHLPRLAGLTVWASAGGFSTHDYVEVCERLDEHEEVAAIELNLSCPNVDEVPESVEETVAVARKVTRKPLYAKLSAAVADIAETARAAEAGGADGLSLVNTIKGLALDERTLQPLLARGAGGLSGPALRPIALAAVHACYRAVKLPILGMGGVATGRDALELLAVGARDVALGTILFADPGAPARIRSELEAELAAHGFAHPGNAVGAAHRPEVSTLNPRLRVNGKKIPA